MPLTPPLPNRQPIMASRVSNAYKNAAQVGAAVKRPSYHPEDRKPAGPRRGIPAVMVPLEGESAPAGKAIVRLETDPADAPPDTGPADERLAANQAHTSLQTARTVRASLQVTLGALHRRGEQNTPLYLQLMEQFKRLGAIIHQAEPTVPKEG